MNDNHPEIEYSPLCEKMTRGGITVQIQIYRMVGSVEGWSLEVITHDGVSTVWSELFATDHDAYAEYWRTLVFEGIGRFAEGRSAQVH